MACEKIEIWNEIIWQRAFVGIYSPMNQEKNGNFLKFPVEELKDVNSNAHRLSRPRKQCLSHESISNEDQTGILRVHCSVQIWFGL